MFVTTWIQWVDMLLNIPLFALSRSHEHEADIYAVEQGYGKSFKNALIFTYSENIDLLFVSEFD